VDSGVGQGDRVNAQFDSLIAKLVVWGPDRATAVARLCGALEAFVILGCTTNLPLLLAIGRSPDFLAGRTSTGWIQAHLAELNGPLLPAPCQALLGSLGFREALSDALDGNQPTGAAQRFATLADPELRIGSSQEKPAFRFLPAAAPHRFTLEAPGLPGPLSMAACRVGTQLALAVAGETLTLDDPAARLVAPRIPADPDGGLVLAPMAGRILEVHAVAGEAVQAGQLLFVLESMKMQFEIHAPRPGRVAAVLAEPGRILQGREPLARLEGEPDLTGPTTGPGIPSRPAH
jgi:acetyl/propionyl-CoA carboxylase alpha subunit